ncbi:MAG: sn-glycerol-1-phosphate dehydrogenase [Ruminococcaceae bacterium]|nr:sn-glycerol-1-phosphate dehydrogenase [Oscillospiraceae bacterium]
MFFEALLKTGLGMGFAQNSRLASGSEHIIVHLIECIELSDNHVPNLHGEHVGICTLAMIRYCNTSQKTKSQNPPGNG